MFDYNKDFVNPFGEKPEPRQEQDEERTEHKEQDAEPEPQPGQAMDERSSFAGRPFVSRPSYSQEPPYTQARPYSFQPNIQGQSYVQAQPFTPPPYGSQSAQGQPYAQGQQHTEQPYGQPYAQPPYAGAQPYTRQPDAQGQPYMQAQPNIHNQPMQQPYGQPYAQQPYTGAQPYAQQQDAQGPPYAPPPPPGYGPSPYRQFAQAQYGQQGTRPKPRKEKKRKDGAGLFGIGRKNSAALVVIIVIACLASGVGGGLIGASTSQPPEVVYEGGSSITIEPSSDISTTEAVAKKVLSSVVGIESVGTFSMGWYYFDDPEIIGIGTGMIIDKSGYILTNSHVVMDGDIDSLTVHLSNGDETEGKLIWNDTGLDLAIVKISASGLEPVELGDSDSVTIGSYVAAIGNPLGLEFSGSITSGVVSGLDRTIQVSDGYGGPIMTMQDLIQVDAAINSGNSGGPLLNNKGQVIGINTAKAQAEGMGFAIPINTAIPIVEKVIKDGSFERVFMGISAADVNTIRENYPRVELQAEKGACITDVGVGSPAERGGLKVKDVIIAIDGVEIGGSDSLIKLLLGYTSGDIIIVTYDREGEILETEVKLLSQSELEEAQQEENPFKEPQRGNQGR